MYQKQKASYYLYGGDGDMARAYVQGYLTALQVNKLPVPVMDGLKQQRDWIATMVAAYELETKRQNRARMRAVLDTVGLDKASFRGMIFNTASVDDEGCELDENGRRISDQYGLIWEGGTHRDWPYYYYIDMRTGAEVPEEQADSHCRKVRYMEIRDGDDLVAEVSTLDEALVEECLTQDILIGDPVNLRYEASAQMHNQLEEYSGVIKKALSKASARTPMYDSVISRALHRVPEGLRGTIALKPEEQPHEQK